tara:strand:- start:1063 stop:1896 length:834 start_codon:yes stop_codon:yes gene_type:complete
MKPKELIKILTEGKSSKYIARKCTKELARECTKELIRLLADNKSVEYNTLEGFREILPKITRGTFRKRSIYGDYKLGKIILNVYNGSPAFPVLDLVDHDNDFSTIKAYGLREWDFKDKTCWTEKRRGDISKKTPTDISREATKELIKVLANEKGIEYNTVEEFREMFLGLINNNNFRKKFREKPINYWGTNLNVMIRCAYEDKPYYAVLDLVENDDDFSTIRDEHFFQVIKRSHKNRFKIEMVNWSDPHFYGEDSYHRQFQLKKNYFNVDNKLINYL